MQFNFISTLTFEPWDWTNPEKVGIGGSETSHIEMCARLSRLGHQVVSYAPTEAEDILGPQEVPWISFRKADFSRPGVWVVYRAPEVLDLMPEDRDIWLVCQDVDYRMSGNELTEARARKLTRIIALCDTHAGYLKWAHPYAAAKVCVSSNGIRADAIERVLEAPPQRNPHRMMYASSPDRGMVHLLARVFPRAKEVVPDLELHIYYGFENIEKVVTYYGERSRIGRNTQQLRALLEQPGVTYHGRTGQFDLYREWAKAGIWCHPSNFTETSCITCMEAQALGAIPITNPVWAVAENVQHGVLIDGDASNPLIQARYALELIRIAVNPGLQDQIREQMMPWAQSAFDWDNWAGQWAGWAACDLDRRRAA